MSEAYFEDICHALHGQDVQVPMHQAYSLIFRSQWPCGHWDRKISEYAWCIGT